MYHVAQWIVHSNLGTPYEFRTIGNYVYCTSEVYCTLYTVCTIRYVDCTFMNGVHQFMYTVYLLMVFNNIWIVDNNGHILYKLCILYTKELCTLS